MLTDLELRTFRTFGFVTLRRLFAPGEVAGLREEFEAELDRVYAGRPFDGTARHWAMMLHPRTPRFAGLLEDERFCRVAEQLYGDDAIGIGTDANRYVGDTGWHPDHGADPTQDCFGVKFAFYLDPVGAATGALRLIPGSHERFFHDRLRDSLKALGLAVAEVPCHVCDSEAGDVIAFDMRCWHASCGGAAGRRMCTCVYYNDPKGEAEEAAARRRAAGSRGTPAHFGRPDEPLYPPEWLANPGRSPRRQRWLERMAQLGYFESPA